MIQVISKRKGGDKAIGNPSIVYIGRPHVLGNPFVMVDESQRSAVIEKYRVWLRGEYRNKSKAYDALLSLAARVKAGEEIALECWCAPCPCHGDVIREAIEAIIK